MNLDSDEDKNLSNLSNITQFEIIPTQENPIFTLNDSLQSNMSVSSEEKSNSYTMDDDEVYEDEVFDLLDKLEEDHHKNEDLGFTQIVENMSSTQFQKIEKSENKLHTPPKTQVTPKLSPIPLLSPLELRKFDIDFWVPIEIAQVYQTKGVNSLFAWQVACLDQKEVTIEGQNLIYSAPTSAGKTLVSELLMIRRVIKKRKRALYILPFISIVEEKVSSLKDVFSSVGISVEGHFENKGGYFEQELVAVCTIEKSNSIINSLIETGCLQDLCMIVVDELHMMSEKERGYLLEMILSKVKFMKKSIQVIGMSATLPNISDLAEWMDAFMFITTYRPVPLQEYYRKTLKDGDYIFDKSKTIVRKLERPKFATQTEDPNFIFTCSFETLKEGNSVLIFCSSRDECEKTAKRIYELIIKSKDENIIKKNEKLRYKLVQNVKQFIKIDATFENCLKVGIAYHHSGLTQNEKALIEKAYRDGVINVLTCTTTLAAGVNLPARRVLFHGIKIAIEKISPIQYKQASGRAGRKGKDTIGESIILSSSSDDQRYSENLMDRKLSLLQSSFKDTSLLGRSILEMIAAGACQKMDDIFEYVKCTLYCFQNGFEKIKDQIVNTVNELMKLTLIDTTRDGRMVISKTGKACSSSSLLPSDAKKIINNLEQTASKGLFIDSDFHLLYFTVHERFSFRIDWNNYSKIIKTLSERHFKVATSLDIDFGLLSITDKSYFQDQSDQTIIKLSKYYSALILEDLISENELVFIQEKYRVPRGSIQSLQKNASVFAGYLSTFCSKLGWWQFEMLFGKLAEMLDYGVKLDILELMKIPGLSKPRARELFKAGFPSIISISESSEEEIYQIISKVSVWSDEKKEKINKEDRELASKLIEEAKILIKEKMNITSTQSSQSVNPILGSPGKRKSDLNNTQDPYFKQPKQIETSPIKKGVNEEILNTNLSIQIIQKDNPKDLIKILEKIDIFSFGIHYEERKHKDLDQKDLIMLNGACVCFIENEKNFKCIYFELGLKSNQDILQNILCIQRIKVNFQLQKILKILFEKKYTISGDFFDPSIAQWMLCPQDERGPTIVQLITKYCPNSSIKGVAKNKIEILCKETAQSLELMNTLIPLLNQSKQYEPFIKAEMKLTPVLAQMEVNGIGFDDNEFSNLKKFVRDKCNTLQLTANKMAHKKFSIPSTKELSNVLFVDLGLPPQSKTEKGNISTKKDDLIKIRELHPIIDIILEFKSLKTLQTHFMDTLPSHKKKYGDEYRIYPIIEHTNTATGRLAYTTPNLQNIPKEREFFDLDKEEKINIGLRKAFVSSNGYLLLSADYKQIELRLLAHCTDDVKLKSIFNDKSGKDIFTQFSIDLLGKPETEITNEDREKAKRIIYGINYSMGAKAVSEVGNMNFKEAESYIENFYKKFVGVEKYLKEATAKCKKLGYITTIHGRRRYLKNIHSTNRTEKSAEERKILNSIMQGSAADLVKVAMINIDDVLKKDSKFQENGKPIAKMVLQVHDELVFEVKEDFLKIFQEMVKDKMEHSIPLQVGTPVRLKVGKNWNELNEI